MTHAERDQLLGQARAHVLHGRLQEAADAYQALVEADPDDVEALREFGALALDVGQVEPAVQLLARAVALKPDDAWGWFHLGRARLTRGEVTEAERAFATSLRLKSSFPEARSNLGVALARLGRVQEAIDAWRAVVAELPDDAAAHANLGRALLEELNRADLALPHLSRWGELQPGETEPLVLLGDACRRLGRIDEALQTYARLVEVHPNSRHLGLLGAAQVQAGMLEGIATLRRAVALDPANPNTSSDLLVALHYDSAVAPEQMFEEHLKWAEALRAGQRNRSYAPPTNEPDPDRRLRIGYVSPDFRQHAAESFIRPILANHDHQRFEITCYYTRRQVDQATSRFRAMADRWRDVCDLSDDALQQQIRTDGIDILVDLAGHTAGHRLAVFARKPAPVQVTYVGYCDTTGLAEIDYRITDAICDPPDEPRRHTEELIQLAGGFSCFAPPDHLPGVAPEPPVVRNNHVTFGSMHALAKLNDRMLDLWSALLREEPVARLLICRHELTGKVRQRLVDRFVARGIELDRLELRGELPGGNWMAVYHEMDVLLDVLPWSGHTTSCEALYMGVPVVTLTGGTHAGRMVASVLTHGGFAGWVARSEREYIRIARELAADVDGLREHRRTLRGRFAASPVMDGAAAAREVERVYREIWHRWCARRD